MSVCVGTFRTTVHWNKRGQSGCCPCSPRRVSTVSLCTIHYLPYEVHLTCIPLRQAHAASRPHPPTDTALPLRHTLSTPSQKPHLLFSLTTHRHHVSSQQTLTPGLLREKARQNQQCHVQDAPRETDSDGPKEKQKALIAGPSPPLVPAPTSRPPPRPRPVHLDSKADSLTHPAYRTLRSAAPAAPATARKPALQLSRRRADRRKSAPRRRVKGASCRAGEAQPATAAAHVLRRA